MRVLLMLALAMQFLLWPAHAQVPARQTVLGEVRSVDLLPAAQLFQDSGGAFPAGRDALARWSATLTPAARINPMGGAYWLVTSVRNDTQLKHWVFDPNNSMVERIEAHFLGDDGSVQRLHTGYEASHEYFLHYGKDVLLEPGREYRLVVRFSSAYFVRTPVVSIRPQAEFRTLVMRENFLIIGALGALMALALVNSFIFSFTRSRAALYYTLYTLTYALAWALPFNVMADLFAWRHIEFHYVPFFLLPVLSTLFYLNFLPLKRLAPRLASISRVNLVLPLLLLPSCFVAIGWAHKLATLVIALWMVLALVCGIVAWKRGFQPARYFVFGFIALMVPALMVVPVNLGLMPAIEGNSQVLTLLGGTLDALLLAFALADQIRLLRDTMEQNVDRRTHELQRANEALTVAKERAEVISRHRIDFLSAMSHDIRTPLAGVIGMMKLGLRDPAVQGRTEEYLRIGLHNGESLLTILNDILDFSKIDAGKLTLETTSFALAGLIADAAGILQGQADAKRLAMRVELAADLPEFVEGDPTRIRQILVNLLGNAIKFTERGEVLLAVSADAAGHGAAAVSFVVSDTGPGIAADVKARLFQKFEQADHSTTRRYGGTGLGLAICKELVGLMGGAISVESRLGAGSRFTVTVPMAIGSAPAAAPEGKPRERHSHQLSILCAEDVRTNQIIIGALLEAMGHKVHIVENGLETLLALGSADFDLVLMDGRMPLMDGEQTTRLIRAGADGVRNARVPIIALTANASAHDCERYMAAGMNGFLSKPVDEPQLFDLIETSIDELLAGGAPLRRVDIAGAAPAVQAPAAIGIAPLPGMTRAQLERIGDAFAQEAPVRLAHARSALDAGDGAAAADAFHALKGSAAYLSSSTVHRLASELEAQAAANQLVQVEDGFGRFERELNAALAGLATCKIAP